MHSSSLWEHHSRRSINDRRNDRTTMTSRLQVNRRWELLDSHRCTQISSQGHRCQAACRGTTIRRPRLSPSDQTVSPLPLVDHLLSRQCSLRLMKMHLVLRTKSPLVVSDLEVQSISRRLMHIISSRMVGSTPMIDLSNTLQFIRIPHLGNQATRRIKIS